MAGRARIGPKSGEACLTAKMCVTWLSLCRLLRLWAISRFIRCDEIILTNKLWIGLVLTARSECLLATAYLKPFQAASSLSSATTASLSSQIRLLDLAVKNETTFPEDAFQGSVCLACLHCAVGEPNVALSRVPSDLATISQRLTKHGRALSGWTHVCIVKGAYIRGWQETIDFMQERHC